MAISPRLAAITLVKGQRWERLSRELGVGDSMVEAMLDGIALISCWASFRIVSSEVVVAMVSATVCVGS
ncbi:hypothetical protein ACHAXN_001033 [Cyclotella atomus]